MSSQRFFGFARPRLTTPAIDGPVRTLKAPERVRIPLTVPGQPSLTPAVKPGEQVKLGQALALTPARTAVHATVAGKVASIGRMHADDGREIQGIEIIASDAQEWVKAHGIEQIGQASWEELTDSLIGLGAASPWKPRAVQAQMGPEDLAPIHTVVIMGCEREPGLGVQRRYLTDHRADLSDGVRAVRTLAGAAARILVLVPESLRSTVAGDLQGAEVQAVTEHYPENHWRLLLASLGGVRNTTIPQARVAGFLVMSAEETALSGRSLREGLPRTAKLVTVAGKGCAEPVTVETVLGAPIGHVLGELGIEIEAGDRVILGGRWQGHAQYDLAAPITRTTDGLVVVPAAEVTHLTENDCINCGRCTSVCPVRLQVALIGRFAEFGLTADAVALGADACIECGLCAYVCPAQRPLLQYVRFATLKHEDCGVRDAEGDREVLDCKLPTDHDLPSAPRAESWTAERR